MKPKVFISVGNTCTQVHTEAADIIFYALEASGLSPRQMEKNEWSSEQPLRAIRRVIKECDGAVIIAFSRYHFPAGIEYKKTTGEIPLTNINMPTTWNQIEAAMAYTCDLPLFVIAEKGLKEDGLLEGRYDWKIYWTDFTSKDLRSEAFSGWLESWKCLVFERANKQNAQVSQDNNDLSKIPIGQLIGWLSVPQIWAIISALFALMAGAVVIAFRVGARKWPF